jgi:hypothetical protein
MALTTESESENENENESENEIASVSGRERGSARESGSGRGSARENTTFCPLFQVPVLQALSGNEPRISDFSSHT